MVSETSVCSRLVLIFTFISAAPPAFTQALQPCNTSAAAVLTAAAVIAQTHWLLCHLLHKYSMDRTITTVTGPALPNVCPALYIHECNYSSVSELHWNLSHNKNHTARPSPPQPPCSSSSSPIAFLVSLCVEMSHCLCQRIKFHCLCIYSLWSRGFSDFTRSFKLMSESLCSLRCKYGLTLRLQSHTNTDVAAVIIDPHPVLQLITFPRLPPSSWGEDPRN